MFAQVGVGIEGSACLKDGLSTTTIYTSLFYILYAKDAGKIRCEARSVRAEQNRKSVGSEARAGKVRL